MIIMMQSYDWDVDLIFHAISACLTVKFSFISPLLDTSCDRQNASSGGKKINKVNLPSF